MEAVKGPLGPRPLYEFTSATSIQDCILMSDDLIGGSSKSHLDFISPNVNASPSKPAGSSSPTSYARFHGHISTSLPADRPNIQRSGYAAFRTPDQSPTLFGRSVWDIDPYAYLALRIKSDGRSYFVNLQTEAVEPTDLHQHRLFAKRPGQWETIMIKWNDFVRTNHGFVVEPQTEILRQKVRTVGIGLTDRVEGPFELCIEKVWATNEVAEGATVVKSEESQLKNKRGEKIQW
jgi:NADH dehydrogenase [ubiquinone] 1 alpha subcomplex assembly factor 1